MVDLYIKHIGCSTNIEACVVNDVPFQKKSLPLVLALAKALVFHDLSNSFVDVVKLANN